MDKRSAPPTPQRRSSLFGRLWRGTKTVARGPIDAAAPGEIARGAGLIRSLLELLQHGPDADTRFRVDEAGSIDLNATAFLHGLTPASLEARIHMRREQTKRAAYALFVLGTVGFFGWILEALSMRLSATRVISAIEFLPFALFLYLSAFRCAWLNWQLRTRRSGSALAYLRTTAPFLPR